MAADCPHTHDFDCGVCGGICATELIDCPCEDRILEEEGYSGGFDDGEADA